MLQSDAKCEFIKLVDLAVITNVEAVHACVGNATNHDPQHVAVSVQVYFPAAADERVHAGGCMLPRHSQSAPARYAYSACSDQHTTLFTTVDAIEHDLLLCSDAEYRQNWSVSNLSTNCV